MIEDRQTRIVKALYGSKYGCLLLRIITKPWFSKVCGALLDTSVSKIMIKRFIRNNKIDMNLYEARDYESFNDFFTRKIKPRYRPVSNHHEDLIAPCDGFLSVHKITGARVVIKGISYKFEELVRDSKMVAKYAGGTMLIFRLTVADYHRYHYPDSGLKTKNTKIDGVLHTVHPIAANARGIYKENNREYFTIHSDNFRDMLMIQVGALLVGRIYNKHDSAVVQRGYEAGWFEYGGSTIVVCLEKNVAELEADLFDGTFDGEERKVKMGQTIGHAIYTNDNKKTCFE